MNDLLERIAAGNRTPGAGSAAAFSGALAGSLCQAAARYAGKAGAPFLESARELTEHLRDAVEEDAAAFDRYWQLLQERRGAGDAARADLDARAAEALRRATEIPIEIARLCLTVAEIGFELHEKGHARARAEAVMAILAALAGGEGAAHTARLNLQIATEGAWAESRGREVREISAQLRACRKRIEALG